MDDVMTDAERKTKNATWAADQVNDIIGVIERHVSEVQRIHDRFMMEPEYDARIGDLGRRITLEHALRFGR